MTRYQVEKLRYINPMPSTIDGKDKTFEEVFISNFGRTSVNAAYQMVDEICQQHPQMYGWYTSEMGVFMDTDGLWYSFVHHAQYVNKNEDK